MKTNPRQNHFLDSLTAVTAAPMLLEPVPLLRLSVPPAQRSKEYTNKVILKGYCHSFLWFPLLANCNGSISATKEVWVGLYCTYHIIGDQMVPTALLLSSWLFLLRFSCSRERTTGLSTPASCRVEIYYCCCFALTEMPDSTMTCIPYSIHRAVSVSGNDGERRRSRLYQAYSIY